MRISILSFLTFFCALALLSISGWVANGQVQDVNLALKTNNPGGKATQSSVYTDNGVSGGPAQNAVDGVIEGNFSAKNIVQTIDTDGWFEVDLGNYYKISKIVIHPATGVCCMENFKPTLIVTDYPINPSTTDESKMKTSSISIEDNPFGVPMTIDEKITASSNFSKKYVTAITKPDTVSVNSVGRYVRLQMNGFGGNTRVALAELEIFGNKMPVAGPASDKTAWNDPTNLIRNPAVGATAKQSTTNGAGRDGAAANAIDGKIKDLITNTAETKWNVDNSWFEVDLGKSYRINKIALYPRSDCCSDMFKSTYLIVTNEKIGDVSMLDDAKIGNSSTFFKSFDPMFVQGEKKKKVIEIDGSVVGRYVRLQIKGWGAVELSEIEILGDPTPVAYTENPSKKWDVAVKVPFDPNYPNFLGTGPNTNFEYYSTLQGSPKIVVAKNSATSFDIAYQDFYSDGKTIRINNYEKSATGFVKNATKSMDLPGKGADGKPLALGVFAGFTKDASGNRYVFTSEPPKYDKEPVNAQVYKIPIGGAPQLLWDAQYFEPSGLNKQVKSLMYGFTAGTSRLVTAGNSLLITTNIDPTHPYQVILDTQDKSKNDSRAFFESTYHHNFGQRAIFDGNDFIVMENRDHDVSLTLTKINPGEKFPLQYKDKSAEELAKENKAYMHANMYTNRIFSVYSHTNFGNHTYTELGNVERGFDDNGYLVLFAGERDWNDKMKGFTPTSEMIKTWSQPQILSPRDIGLVHVKKNFDKDDTDPSKERVVNWLNSKGEKSQCPKTVDNSKLVNSTGAVETITYLTANDGWKWEIYAPGLGCENTNERSLITKGVKWITDLSATYKKDETTKKAIGDFTSVNHPKLVRIDKNKYVVLWEEWKAESVSKYGETKKQYLTTKAALITLKAAPNGEVNIELTSAPKDLGKVRLMPGDDAFEFEGKAAWAVGDITKGKLLFYTVDASLNLASYGLEL